MSPSDHAGEGTGPTGGGGRRRRKRSVENQELFPEGEVNVPYLPADNVADRVELPSGFRIRRLLLLGAKLPSAELAFASGLNVVVGPSNAGKSFAFYLLDFAFGARKLKKLPEEARAYDEVVVEIESVAGETFTIRRGLRSPTLRWYDVPFDRLGEPAVRPKVLSRKHQDGKTNSVSAQYLALSRLSGLRLRNNQDNATQELSFRNVLKLCAVDESRIISDGSPICGPNPNTNTAEKSLFELMLSGRDASQLVPVENVLERRSRLQAQADLLDQMLERGAQPASTDGGTEPDAAALERQRLALDATVARLEGELADAAASMDEVRATSEELNANLVEDKSRLLVLRELLARFDLLRQSYRTDLDRLDFIDLGNDLLQQLPSVACPTCGQPMHLGHEHRGAQPAAMPLTEDVRAACDSEARTIRVLLRDLEASVEELTTEAAQLRNRIRDRSAGIRQLEDRVQEELRPRLVAATGELRHAMAVRQEVVRQESTLQHRASLMERRYDITRELDRLSKRSGRPIAPPRQEVGTEAFTDAIRSILSEWLPEVGSVRFDWETMDLVVGSRPRAEQGKGVRAIWFSALVIGLMRLCRAEARAHPGFLILDSPLTTFRGPDRPHRGPEDVSESVEQAFFRHLATTSAERADREQIIIFDNKEPPEDVADRANVIRFTGKGGGGREGFVPSRE